ncbi:MAG: response regulator [Proteobacteria bacterium]|nr:response regulator [Pseudomonadota bacterium]
MSEPLLKRILVVEDDPSQGRLLEYWLRTEGYAPTLVGTASEGLLRVQEEHWSLVLSDVDLPGDSGLTLLRESKRFAPRTPVVMMTGHAAASIASEAIARGADGYLLKPLSRDTLLQHVKLRTRGSESVTVLALGVDTPSLAVGCGGTLGRMALLGNEVHLAVLGPIGPMASFPFSGFVELELSEASLYGPELQRCLELEVARIEPDVLFIPSTTAHCAKARMIHLASQAITQTVSAAYAYATSEVLQFAPVRVQPIDEQLEAKLAWMSSLGVDSPTCERVRGRASHWGALTQGHAEAFEVVFQLGR